MMDIYSVNSASLWGHWRTTAPQEDEYPWFQQWMTRR